MSSKPEHRHNDTIDLRKFGVDTAPLGFIKHHPRYAGPRETFRGDPVGSLPNGWTDVATLVANAPDPSAVVVKTTNAFGDLTHALSMVPAIADSQGIFREIDPAKHYSVSVDVRIDQFSDVGAFDPDCGCPEGSEVDFAIQAEIMRQEDDVPFHLWKQVGIYAASGSQEWSIFAWTDNVLADVKLGVPVTLGTWYNLELDLNVLKATVHGKVTDIATGDVLADQTVSLRDFGDWDPKVDGTMNVKSFFDAELSAEHTPGMTTIDNIDVPKHGNEHQASHWTDGIWAGQGW